jgi:hypothetical protein
MRQIFGTAKKSSPDHPWRTTLRWDETELIEKSSNAVAANGRKHGRAVL